MWHPIWDYHVHPLWDAKYILLRMQSPLWDAFLTDQLHSLYPQEERGGVMRFICILLAVLLTSTLPPCWADVVVLPIEVSDLPFDLSPNKFDNSPNKFDNSLSKFDNSSSKFENSSSRFDNSPSKFENSRNGSRRILVEEDGSYFYAGYYVFNKNGLINFFSTSGERLFYNPATTQAIFNAEDGEFCGVFVKIKSKLTFSLIRRCQKILLLSE